MTPEELDAIQARWAAPSMLSTDVSRLIAALRESRAAEAKMAEEREGYRKVGRAEECAVIVADMRHIEKFDSDEQTRFVAGLLADRYQSGQHLKEKA